MGRSDVLKLAGIFVGTIIAAACATILSPERNDVLLVKARLVTVTPLPDPPVPPGDIAIDGTFRLTFKVLQPLIGKWEERSIVVQQHSAWPITGIDYFVVETRQDGMLKPQWWQPAGHGLCLTDEEAKGFTIAAEVAALEKQYPCTWNWYKGRRKDL